MARMETRLKQLSMRSSPTTSKSESPSHVRPASSNKILSSMESSVHAIRPTSNPISHGLSSAQIGLNYIQSRSNITNPTGRSSNERTYINVNPIAYISRQGITVNPNPAQLPRGEGSPQSTVASNQPHVPAIPRSQVVKKFVEPSYSTILQPERDGITIHGDQSKTVMPNVMTKNLISKHPMTIAQVTTSPPPLLSQTSGHISGLVMQQPGLLYPVGTDSAIYANTYAVNSNYSVTSNYSELEALRSSDSQGSTEEELGGINPNQLYSGMLTTDRLSPVSSSYSELRQATRPRPPHTTPSATGNSYHFQQGSHHQYDTSLYEPITPGIRARTISVGASLASPLPNEQISFNNIHSHSTTLKAGTSAISMGSANDAGSNDYYGICSTCVNKIIGEGTGCTAMGRLYHIDCFRCTNCDCQLQGKPFYALDGKPFCEADYMQTLEKCCKCLEPILDRILRATGKPYHPQCFTCVVCNKSLDGVPFTVDAKNQIHCIEDFHRRFAPRCSVCQQPIMPQSNNEETVRVVALDRSFHVLCYKCEDCGLLLSSESEGRGCYPLDDHVLCKQCNTQRIQLLTQGIE